MLSFRVTQGEAAEIDWASQDIGESMSRFIRNAVMQRARQVLAPSYPMIDLRRTPNICVSPNGVIAS